MRQLGQKSQRRLLVKIFALTFIFGILTFALLKFFNLDQHLFKGPQTVVELITDTGLKSTKSRVNILLLGTGGQNHEGPDLTDTMILVSVDKHAKDVVLVSIPRDLWVPSLSAKINSAYAFGQEENRKGKERAKNIVAELFDLPIHYAFRIDFDGFVKAIDLVSGIDVQVDNAFSDPKYPIAGKEDDTCGIEIETKEENGANIVYFKDATGSATLLTSENDPFTCRYETVTFAQGLIHMDGTTALKFARSRFGTGGEGSDFARSARQQKVILTFRQKVLSAQTLTNPKTVIDLANTFGQSIDTDITDSDVPLFIKLGQKIDPSLTRNVVLDAQSEASLLEIGDFTNHGGQFVLVPKNNSWSDLAEYVQGEIFKGREE